MQVHNHVIHLLSKKNGRIYVSARVYVYEWDWCYLSRKNLYDFAHDTLFKYHWSICEYKGNIYNAVLTGGFSVQLYKDEYIDNWYVKSKGKIYYIADFIKEAEVVKYENNDFIMYNSPNPPIVKQKIKK